MRLSRFPNGATFRSIMKGTYPMMANEWKIVAQTRDRLGESALWHARERAIYWIDGYGPTVHRLRLGAAKPENWKIPDASLIGSLVFATGGRLLLALDTGLKLFDPVSGALKDFADPNEGRPEISYNDGKIDRFGRYWIGTFDVPEIEPRGILYCVDPQGRATLGDSGFAVCNGPAFSPDGRTLYFSDSVGRRILSYDMSAQSPRLVNRRVFAAMAEDEGLPDGLTVDTSGDVWCAHYGAGRVTRFSPDGQRKSVLHLPCPAVTSCSFGGDDLSTLFVTSGWSPGVERAENEPGPGGALFAMGVDARGLPEPEFAIGGTTVRGSTA
jgi:D-xylonolactonase